MADGADEAQARQEAEERLRSLPGEQEVPRSTHCHNCGELLEEEAALFCDDDCRYDWQGRQRERALRPSLR